MFEINVGSSSSIQYCAKGYNMCWKYNYLLRDGIGKSKNCCTFSQNNFKYYLQSRYNIESTHIQFFCKKLLIDIFKIIFWPREKSRVRFRQEIKTFADCHRMLDGCSRPIDISCIFILLLMYEILLWTS